MNVLYVAAIAVGIFFAGKRYGATVEKEAVTVSLSVFAKAKAALLRVVTKAQAEAAAEVARLEAVAKKYL